jgi:hypothetical protein
MGRFPNFIACAQPRLVHRNLGRELRRAPQRPRNLDRFGPASYTPFRANNRHQQGDHRMKMRLARSMIRRILGLPKVGSARYAARYTEPD